MPGPRTSLLWALVATALFACVDRAAAQQATIVEEERVLETYPYSDPNPLPGMAIDDARFRFYPYYSWDGYAHEARPQEWDVVRMENPYIEVTVLPQVGGKVWGAVEKSTGREFIYRNEVMKFRSIGIRGPWTSGGIEHNFGLDLGHTPATASPVDYLVREHDDGSVSVVVGTLDLPSRTTWRVTVKLPADRAYFETNSLWYNPTPLHHSYLSYEVAAVEAREDLQLFFPGRYAVGHGGDVQPWPVDAEGRDLSFYRNNDFGGHKSYHVMGSYSDYYAGYWHDADFGFGHWAPYTDAPGKKIWIWSLARSGGIWEDLLTDTDGQYVEPQSGVKFNQAMRRSGWASPFNQLILEPYRTDVKHEIWYPIKDIGGVVDASPWGVLNAERDGDVLHVALNTLQALRDTLTVTVGERVVRREALDLAPMAVFRTDVPLPSGDGVVRAAVGAHGLVYSSDPDADALHRPVRSPEVRDDGAAEHVFRIAEDEMSMRRYDDALVKYREVLDREPTHSRALTRLGEIYYRRGEYKRGLGYVRQVLEQNAYDPGANFVYGILQRRLGRLADAKDGLSWAALSAAYRSGAYAELAELFVEDGDLEQAVDYARRSLDFNAKNLAAYEVLAMANRRLERDAEARAAREALLEIDPLNHFARFERYLAEPTAAHLDAFRSMIRNELPHETYLELAMTYVGAGLVDEAVQVLEKAPEYPTVHYWLAYLTRDAPSAESRAHLDRALALSPRLVFPFRLETLPVLSWASEQDPSWKTAYYLGLLHWSLHRTDEAEAFFARPGDSPTFAPFYVVRGKLLENERPDAALRDYERAVQVESGEWRTWHALVTLANGAGAYREALDHSSEARRRFPDNYIVGMDHAVALVNNGRYEAALAVLDGIRVLPYEGAREGHDIYEAASVLLALSYVEDGDCAAAVDRLVAAKEWPEHLGAGRPFDPDTRLQDYVLGRCFARLGESARAAERFEAVAKYTQDRPDDAAPHRLLGILALQSLGRPHDARDLLEAWQADAAPDDLTAAWAAALLAGDDADARRIERSVAGEGEGAPLWEDPRAVLLRALQVTRWN